MIISVSFSFIGAIFMCMTRNVCGVVKLQHSNNETLADSVRNNNLLDEKT